MNTYGRMHAYLAGLAGVPDGLTWKPGPDIPDVPGRYVVLTPYGGSGLSLEGAVDGRAWQVRVAGLQNNYDDAESIANLFDVGLLNIATADIGGVHVSGVRRVGGSPTALMLDDADRTVFVCSYIIDTAMELAN